MTSLNGALPAADTTVTLQFGKDGTASGSDGCNRYTTQYVQDGENLTFVQPMAGTMMACPEPAMTQADEYRAGAGGGDPLHHERSPIGALCRQRYRLDLHRRVPGVGRHVMVRDFDNNGREAVVGLLEGTEITLNFEETSLNGSAGCNNYFAGYMVSGNTITVEPPGATFMFCESPEGVMEQEAGVPRRLLESAATFSIEGDQLWLRTAGDAIADHRGPRGVRRPA